MLHTAVGPHSAVKEICKNNFSGVAFSELWFRIKLSSVYRDKSDWWPVWVEGDLLEDKRYVRWKVVTGQIRVVLILNTLRKASAQKSLKKKIV